MLYKITLFVLSIACVLALAALCRFVYRQHKMAKCTWAFFAFTCGTMLMPAVVVPWLIFGYFLELFDQSKIQPFTVEDLQTSLLILCLIPGFTLAFLVVGMGPGGTLGLVIGRVRRFWLSRQQVSVLGCGEESHNNMEDRFPKEPAESNTSLLILTAVGWAILLFVLILGNPIQYRRY